MKDPKVCIVILNWNGLSDTRECLKSIFESRYKNYEVIVVDNASTDLSVQAIRTEFPSAKIITNIENVGYTGGNNRGIKYALNRNADYIWLLNNDTVIEKDCLKEMVDTGQANREVGLISPLIYFYNQHDQLQYCGTVFDQNSNIFLRDLEQFDRNISKNNENTLLLWGTALLIKKIVIEKIGNLNEKFFAYFEDIDYSLRARKSGFHCTIVSTAKIYHKDASSTGGRDSPARAYYYTRNLNLLWKKHLRGMRRLIWLYKYTKLAIFSGFSYLSKDLYKSADACLDGLWDGLLGVGGSFDKNKGMPKIFKVPYFLSYELKKRHCNFLIKRIKEKLNKTFY
jgi:GT2 family glycosyltransferase